MRTRNYKAIDKKSIGAAASLLRNGEVVAFPTETVYGLGADATNEKAVEKIFKAKGRPSDNPLIVHVPSKEQLNRLVLDYPHYVHALIDAFSPGPITYVLKSAGVVAENVTAGLSTVAVRIPDHPIALSLLEECQLPIAAPSANVSGKPSPTKATHVLEDLNGRIAAIVDGGDTKVGVESTVVDCTTDVPTILRLGKVTQMDIVQVVGSCKLDSGLVDQAVKPKSPGLKYKHYAPEIPLVLVNDREMLERTVAVEKEKGNRVGVIINATNEGELSADQVVSLGRNENEMATNLYHSLRSFKKEEVDLIICETFPTSTVGKAVMDRIKRAASHIVSE